MIPSAASSPFFLSFKASEAGVLEGVPPWLKEARQDDGHFLDAFELPVFRNEEWKYTSLTGLWRQSFKPVERLDGVISDELKPFLINGARNILIVNGHIAGDCSSSTPGLPGVSLLAGDKAFGVLDENRRYFSASTRNDADLFLRLNRLFFKDPLVMVASGAAGKGLVHIVNVVTLPGAAVFPRVFIRAQQGAELNVFQSYVSFAAGEHLNAPVTDIVLEEGARLEYAERHMDAPALSHVGSVRVWQKKDSAFKSMMSTAGAGIFRSNISVMIEEPGASAEVNGLHHLKAEAHADSHTLLEHLAPDTTSNQLYKCILQDASRSVFNGRIFVHREAQKTNSYQLNKNLLLSRECRVDTKPQLEIKADDVKCTHGATISQCNPEQLFYFQTRAVGREDARRMLVRGFRDDVLSRARHSLIRESLMAGSL